MKVLDYYNKFECIGSDCEDSCCSGWTVAIDKKTYRKYKNISDLPFRKEVLSHIGHDRRTGMGGAHKIKLREDKSCPFLNETKLCDIQQKYGESHLSNTCTIFPRNRRYFFTESESALSLACPEVTRLAILPESPVQLIEVDEADVHSKRIQSTEVSKEDLQISIDYQQPYEAVRTVSFHVLQMRQISLDERLFLLGFFLNTFSEVSQTKNYTLMNEVIVEFIDTTIQNPDEVLTQYQQFKSNPSLKLEYSLTMLLTDYPTKINPRLSECMDWLNKGLDIDYNQFELDKILEKYQHAEETFYYPFLQQHGYMLENYLISHLFYSDFPIAGQQSIFDSYLKLISCFTNIQTMLVGIASFHQNLDTAHVLQLIQSYERFIAHNHKYLPSLLQKLEDLKFNSLAAMMILIKP
ncbi:flagellin lysine-N-methylase [Pseudomonadota bacterium]|nr:flagellin lysine-N-methylase [Pseudomonadota bacterium]